MEAARIDPRLPEGAPAPAPVLQLRGVERRYGAFRPALGALDLALGRGEFLVVQGPGGCGKSVLLRLMAGLERPSAGSVHIAGEDLAALRPRARAHMRRSLGYLPPGAGLLLQRSVLHNVALAPWVAGNEREEGLRRARAALALVGIDPDRQGDLPVGQLPAGERQCVAVARAIANRPALLLLDDLIAPLDTARADRVLNVLSQFADAGIAIVATQRADAGAAAPLPAPWPARARALRLSDGVPVLPAVDSGPAA